MVNVELAVLQREDWLVVFDEFCYKYSHHADFKLPMYITEGKTEKDV